MSRRIRTFHPAHFDRPEDINWLARIEMHVESGMFEKVDSDGRRTLMPSMRNQWLADFVLNGDWVEL